MLKTDLDIDINIHEEKFSPNKDISGTEKEKNVIIKFTNAIHSIEEKFQLLDMDISEELKLNILRGQVFLLVSSVDFYIHEIVKVELINIIKKERKRTSALKYCLISLEALLDYFSEENEEILENAIINRNTYKTFLSPTKMSEAISLISKIDIFKNIYPKLKFSNKKELTIKMQEIYKRRNSIAHQMDYDYIKGTQQVITKEEVEDYIHFYKNFIKELHNLIINENI